jgi:hypothetical protein
VKEGPKVAGVYQISTVIFPTSWMLMEIPVVTNTTFHTINQTVMNEAVNAVKKLEINSLCCSRQQIRSLGLRNQRTGIPGRRKML